jgi:hypothetical protein
LYGHQRASMNSPSVIRAGALPARPWRIETTSASRHSSASFAVVKPLSHVCLRSCMATAT